MKKLIVFLSLLLSIPAHAISISQLIDLPITPANVINWRVGEYTNYDLQASFGSLGNMTKTATHEQGNALWVKSEIGMMGQKQIAEQLIDRATGQIIEYRENGQKKEIPNTKIEIIDQEATSITVPAGTFEVIHITAKTEDGKKIEVWMNPRDITLDGAAQMKADTGIFPITMKLTKFGR